MVKITAPDEGFNGSVGPVQFSDGCAVTDNHAVITYCRDLGYKVEAEAVEEPEPEPVAPAKPARRSK